MSETSEAALVALPDADLEGQRRNLITTLCALQAEVAGGVYGYQHAADCFCLEDREPYHLIGWRNEGIAVEFIVQAVREKVAAQGAPDA